MKTEVEIVDREQDYSSAVGRAARILRRGGIVGFPTETVYGVGVCVTDDDAIVRLRDIKERPPDKAFTVHVGSKDSAAAMVPDLSGLAGRLVRKALPGPLTLILEVDDPSTAPVAKELGEKALAAMYFGGTIGLRFPDDDVSAALFRAVGAPVVAASANRAGNNPPRDARSVLRELDGRIDLLLDAGETRYASASTIIRVRGNQYELLREGVYDARTVKRLATLHVLFVCTGNTCRSPMAEGIAKHAIAHQLECDISQLAERGVVVSSAGTGGGFGVANEHAVAVMRKRQIDISSHVSTELTPDLLRQADCVFAMTDSHVDSIRRMIPDVESRTSLLVEGENVFDPIGGGEDDYEQCARMIEKGVSARLQEIEL